MKRFKFGATTKNGDFCCIRRIPCHDFIISDFAVLVNMVTGEEITRKIHKGGVSCEYALTDEDNEYSLVIEP